MAGLVAYASSDEGSDNQEDTRAQAQSHPQRETSPGKSEINATTITEVGLPLKKQSTAKPLAEAPREEGKLASVPVSASTDKKSDGRPPDTLPPSAPPSPVPPPIPPAGEVLIGPSRPPADSVVTGPGAETTYLLSLGDSDGYNEGGSTGEVPLSPYSAERAAIRQFTLPRIPDFDIPGSPEGGDDAASAATLAALNKKFATFLELKQKKDTHFNARLAQSDAMKNPALMDKLMTFVGLPANAWGRGGAGADAADDEGKTKLVDQPVDTAAAAAAAAQYATTLPTELWDPAALPSEAYRRSLRRLQEDAAKKRARAPGERIEFVPASTSLPGVGTPGGLLDGSRHGIERDRQSGAPAAKAGATTATATGKRKTRFDQ